MGNAHDPKAARAKTPPSGNAKVTRDDWLSIARETLIREGVEAVKIKPLGERLGVSRSSFYWYFRSRQDLLDALLAHWQATNNEALIDMAGAPAATITEAVGNVFRCAINPALFDTRLDFAIRAWARHDPALRLTLRTSERQRLEALQAMFERFGYPQLEAIARARILYFMQVGYDDAQLDEPMQTRNMLMPAYLVGFTGRTPSPSEISALQAYAKALDR